MKSRLILITTIPLLLLWSGISFSQEAKRTFEVVDYGGVDDVSLYLEALSRKDLDAYRLVSSSRIIRFESGFEIKLYSAEKLENEFGRKRDPRFIQRMGDEPTYPWLWSLRTDGKIVDKRIQSAENN